MPVTRRGDFFFCIPAVYSIENVDVRIGQAEVNVPAAATTDSVICLFANADLYREVLAAMFEREVGVPCICCEDPEEMKRKTEARQAKANLLLIDSDSRDFETVLPHVVVKRPDAPDGLIPVLYNLMPATGIEKRAFARGVRGFFYRRDTLENVIKGIRMLLKGELWMPRSILVDFALESDHGGGIPGASGVLLTRRETQVLALVRAGASNGQIAEKLAMSPFTVKTHLYNVFKKIEVPNRFQAARWATKYL